MESDAPRGARDRDFEGGRRRWAVAGSAMASEPIIGIDLGTTNSVAGMVVDGVPTIIPSRVGQRLTPSVVAVSQTGKKLVGGIAKRQAITNPGQTVHAAKRLIGRAWSSPSIQKARESLPYPLCQGAHDDVRILLGGGEVSIPEVSARVLTELRLDAEAWLGRPVTRAVITVPAYFHDGQRQATRDAARIAGLEVLRILNEPTAAALAYGFGRNLNGKIIVFDFGGGTFDISVLELRGDVFEVLATAGDSMLGGEDLDQRILEWLVFGFAKEHGVDLRHDKMAVQRLREAAEKVKCELSHVQETRIDLPFLHSAPGGGAAIHLQRLMTRQKLEELTSDLVDRTIRLSAEVMREAGITVADVAEVVLVGGQTRMPLVQEAVKRLFGREPCKGVHPDEVVALGAALQGHALGHSDAEILLLDVTPQSLGIMVAGGFTNTLIPKNTTVPTVARHVFTTVKDNQTSARILVVQGESDRAEENELLGEFALSGLRPAPRGQVEIEVRIEISADGIVSVSARDTETGLSQSIQVTASTGLTEEEMERIVSSQRESEVCRKDVEQDRWRQEILGMLDEAEAALPKVRSLLLASGFGGDAEAKAVRIMSWAREVTSGSDREAMAAAREQLERTLVWLKGLLNRVGPVEHR